ncbi:hypothetical protein AB0C34_29165 [Nocardia sp. NPDC049220]
MVALLFAAPRMPEVAVGGASAVDEGISGAGGGGVGGVDVVVVLLV